MLTRQHINAAIIFTTRLLATRLEEKAQQLDDYSCTQELNNAEGAYHTRVIATALRDVAGTLDALSLRDLELPWE